MGANIPRNQWNYAIINRNSPGEMHKIMASHSKAYQFWVTPINPDISIDDLKVWLKLKGLVFDDYIGDYYVENPELYYLFLWYFESYV